MNCPKCDHLLEECAINHARVDRCRNCGGLWFDEGELQAVRDERDEDLGWLDYDLWQDESLLAPSGKSVACPRDGKPLFKIKYGSSDVLVDVCLECRGVWLDREELEHILSALEAKIDRETIPEYLGELETELKDLVASPGHTREDVRNILILMKLIEYRLLAQHPRLAEIIASLPD